MANRILNNTKTVARNLVIVPLTIYPNGTGDPSFTPSEFVSDVSRDGYGTYTITLKDTFASMDSYSVSLQLHTNAAGSVKLGDVDLSAKTVVVYAWDADSLNDFAANDNTSIGVVLYLRT